MKKPAEYREIAYQLRITDIRHVDWVHPMYFSSLQLAVDEVAKHVLDFDHYKKVYRNFRDNDGFYVGAFKSIPTDAKKAQLLLVEIVSYEQLTSQEIDTALDFIERIYKGVKAR